MWGGGVSPSLDGVQMQYHNSGCKIFSPSNMLSLALQVLRMVNPMVYNADCSESFLAVVIDDVIRAKCTSFDKATMQKNPRREACKCGEYVI